MSLTSVIFVGFLCMVCAVAYLVPCRFRYIWLLLCSYAFYLYDALNYERHLPAFLLMLAATFVSYLCTLGIAKSKEVRAKRIFLVITLLVCLGLLLVLKYTNFFLDTLGDLVSLLGGTASPEKLSLVLPLGISYYTLQTVSYSVDVYKGKLEPEKNPLRYALYVSFFPGIVTGPINRATEMLPQYKNPQSFSYDRISGGLFRVLWGFAKKLVIADHIGKYTAAVFKTPGMFGGPYLVLAVLLFAYQLYADFSGSCDIAIGAARMLGFDFMENFARPFSSKTYTDFWRRWHISLTSFFRDYIYFPLGGSRVPMLRWVFNTMLVFVVSALWHGDGVGYLIWGFLNGAFLVAAKLLAQPKNRLVAALPGYRCPAVRGLFQRIFVYLLFAGSLAFFAIALYNTPTEGFFTLFVKGWSVLGGEFLKELSGTGLPLNIIVLLAAGVLGVELVEWAAVKPGKSTMSDWIRRRKWYLRWPLYYLLIGVLLVYGMFGQSTFIYQQY